MSFRISRKINPVSAMLVLLSCLFAVPVNADPGETEYYRDSKFALGVGASLVRFDSKITITDKQSGDRLFLDPEGHLGLPFNSSVSNFYGGYRFNQNHSVGVSYFKINRSSVLLDFDASLGDLIVANARVELTDRTSFTRFFYGYTLFNDSRSNIRLLGGIFLLDLKYILEASGQITAGGMTSTGTVRKEVSQVAPLPMFGLNFLYYFTPKWSVDTAVLLVGGSYKEVSAGVLQTAVWGTYHISERVGVDIGVSYFDADVTIDKETEKQEIQYGYDGLFIGVGVRF